MKKILSVILACTVFFCAFSALAEGPGGTPPGDPPGEGGGFGGNTAYKC